MGWSTNFTERLCKLVNASLNDSHFKWLKLTSCDCVHSICPTCLNSVSCTSWASYWTPNGQKTETKLASCWKRFWFAATKLIFFPENIWPFIDAKTRNVFFIEINQVERVLRRTKLFAKYVSLTKLAELILVFFVFLKMGNPWPLLCFIFIFSNKHHYNFYNK